MNVYFYWSGQNFDFSNFLAVASAAIHNEKSNVFVLIDERPRKNIHFDRLSRVPGVHIEQITPGDVMSSKHLSLYYRMHFTAHRADLIRFSMLSRYGGLYLDTDTLTCRSLDNLPTTLLLYDGKIVHIGIMALPRRHPLLERMLQSSLEMPEDDLNVYQSIVYRWTNLVRETCSDLQFGDLQAFLPVHWKEWECIFVEGGFAGNRDRIHILHHYGYFSRQYTANMDAQWLANHPCLYSALARPILDMLGVSPQCR